MRAGDVLPFISAIPGIDDDPAASAAVEALVAPFKHLWGGDLSPEAAMAEVHQAEQRLLMARRAAKKVYKKAGRDTAGMFGDGDFILRTTGDRWREEAVKEACTEAAKPPESEWLREKAARAQRAEFPALMHLAMSGSGERPKPSFKEEMAMRRAGTWTEPMPKSEDIAAKFANASAEEQARLICAAAARHRPLKGK